MTWIVFAAFLGLYVFTVLRGAGVSGIAAKWAEEDGRPEQARQIRVRSRLLLVGGTAVFLGALLRAPALLYLGFACFATHVAFTLFGVVHAIRSARRQRTRP